ncbi:MAG: hypothetical protein JNK15_24275 [Planctomycetes bacterium]|nr:hypothetical protein [Planctomycetota bacterium]
MKSTTTLLPFLFLAPLAVAQTTSIFPDEYVAVAEGPLNSPNYPLAYGTSRVMCLYDRTDLQIPLGHTITRLGFRQDATLTTMDAGRSLQLEVRMGYSANTPTSMVTTFDTNWVGTPTTVFGPAVFALPNLRDSANPLPNGQFFVNLTTPFVYSPAAGQNLVVEYRVFGTSGGGAQFNYRLDRADYYSPVTNGPAGCQHTSGGPAVLTLAGTRPGAYFSADIASGPANSPTVLVMSLGNGLVAPYALSPVFVGISPTCTGQINPIGFATLDATTGGSGYASWAFVIPNNPVFADFRISAQALFLDFFSPGGIVVSNGAEVLTGASPRTAVVAAQGAPTVVTTGSKSNNYCPVAFFTHQ